MKSPGLAILGGVEFGLEALESSLSDDLGSNFIPQSVASLLERQDIPLVAPPENEPLNGHVSPTNHTATSTVKVKLSPNIAVVIQVLRLGGMLLTN